MSSTVNQSTSRGASDRPLGLAALAGLDVAFGALGVLGGAAAFGIAPRVLAYAGTGLSTQTLDLAHVLVPILATALIGLGACSMVLGWGLWRGARWAWAVAVVAAVVHGVGDLGSLATRGHVADNLIGMALVAAIVYYLTRPGVRAYCGLEPARR